jgi:hypothetical protein
VIATDYALFTERLPETCAGLKVDPAAPEYKDFTYVAAGWVEAGEMGGAMPWRGIRQLAPNSEFLLAAARSVSAARRHRRDSFNMPLELGLFLGAKRYGDPAQKRKKCLVLDVERFRYQKVMSDIAGQDIETHGGDARLLIDRVRAFLNSATRGAPLSSGAVIAADYDRFTERLPETCAGLKVDLAALEYKDFTYVAAGWVEAGEMGGAMTWWGIR